MDSVFVVVDKAPESITKYEMVLERPSFMDEIAACEKRRGGTHNIGANYLRAIAEEIGRRYDKTFNPYRHVVPTDYAGVSCPTLKDVSVLVHKMFESRYPKIYESYYEYKVRARPFDIRVVYLVDEAGFGAALKRAGLKEIQQSEIEAHVGVSKKPAEKAPAVLTPVEVVSEVVVDAAPQLEQSQVLEELANSVEIVPEIAPEVVTKQSKNNKNNKKSKV